MKTLQMFAVGLLFGTTAIAASAAEEPSVPTITITAKRHASVPALELVPPQANVEFTVVLPTDMPEAHIDYHLSPISAPPAPAVE
jgi:hypothetical protein